MSCPSLPSNKYPPKTGDYCRTEIELMVKVLLDNKDLFVSNQVRPLSSPHYSILGPRIRENGCNFGRKTESKKHERLVPQYPEDSGNCESLLLSLFTLCFQENRWTKVIKDNITDEQKAQLKDLLVTKGTIIHSNQPPSAPPLYQDAVGEHGYESTEGPKVRDGCIDSTSAFQKKSSGCFGCWTRRSRQGYESSWWPFPELSLMLLPCSNDHSIPKWSLFTVSISLICWRTGKVVGGGQNQSQGLYYAWSHRKYKK